MKKWLTAWMLTATIVYGCTRRDVVFNQGPIEAMTAIASIGTFKKASYKVMFPNKGMDSARIHLTLFNSQQQLTSHAQKELLAQSCARRLKSLLRHPEKFARISVTIAETQPNKDEQFISRQTFEFSPSIW